MSFGWWDFNTRGLLDTFGWRSDTEWSVFVLGDSLRIKLAAMILTAATAGTVVLPGCRSAPQAAAPEASAARNAPTTNPTGDEVIATVNGIDINRRQLEEPLVESYGLTMLLNLVQVELAKQQLAHAGMHITPEDVQQERDRTFARMFSDASKSDYDQLLEQFLRQQHLSRDEFDMVIETNAYLRKFAEPQLAGQLTEERVHAAFNQLYGENRVVHDIELTNVAEAGEAKRRLAAGKSFEQVAREMSLDRQTGALGGELPQFSSQSPNVPQPIKDAAFSLQLGQVSDPLLVGTTTHLIKLTNIIPPKIVKYDDVKDSVRELLSEQMTEYTIKQFRNKLAQVAVETIRIQDPVLKGQWEERLNAQNAKIHDRDSALAELNRQRANAATQPTTTPGERPPATKPGIPMPGAPSSASPTTRP